MRILFIGGTRFVGRAMAESALARDHDVTLLHRGQTNDPAFDDAEHLLADRDGDLAVLDGREFDATIDVCAYVPRQVRTLAERSATAAATTSSSPRCRSTTSPTSRDRRGRRACIRLADPTTEEVTGETYGGLKVLCEEAAEAGIRRQRARP